jgi:hypothetical protein
MAMTSRYPVLCNSSFKSWILGKANGEQRGGISHSTLIDCFSPP